MKRLFCGLGVLVFAAALLLPASLQASTFVFTNNDINGSNSVTAFSVDSTTGALTKLGTTGTGGNGCGGSGFYASNRIVTSPDGKYLYVSNGGSNDITIFRVNERTGALTAVGSPVATGNASGCTSPMGISLAVTSDGGFLYAATAHAKNIRIFSVAWNGTLSPVGGLVSLPRAPDGIKVRPDGRFLAVALAVSPPGHELAMFSIEPWGALTAVPGSPFPDDRVTGVDFNSRGDLLFGGVDNAIGTIVDVFGVGRNGALTPVTGSPFTFYIGINSDVVLWNPLGNMLFVSNTGSNSLIDFIVGPKGALTLGANQPVNLGSKALAPAGMAVSTIRTPTGGTLTLLYVAVWEYSQVFVFTVDPDGTLTWVPASPFATGEGYETGLLSLAVDSFE